MHSTANPLDLVSRKPFHGVYGMFSDAEQLKKAARAVRDRGVKNFDAFSPFPVHGIEEAMGLKRSFLPWVTFFAGLTGGSLGLFFQYWTSAVDWPINVGGKPYASWPAFIPVTFECTILFAGLATAGALILSCGLPNFRVPPLHPAITDDKFALYISSDDPNFKEQELSELMKREGAYEIRAI